jgi:hypothetical protein
MKSQRIEPVNDFARFYSSVLVYDNRFHSFVDSFNRFNSNYTSYIIEPFDITNVTKTACGPTPSITLQQRTPRKPASSVISLLSLMPRQRLFTGRRLGIIGIAVGFRVRMSRFFVEPRHEHRSDDFTTTSAMHMQCNLNANKTTAQRINVIKSLTRCGIECPVHSHKKRFRTFSEGGKESPESSRQPGRLFHAHS